MAQLTMQEAVELLEADYKSWFTRGITTGKWVQKGPYNLIGVAGVGKTQMISELGTRCAKWTKETFDEQLKHLGFKGGNDEIVELYTSASLDPESVAGASAPGMAHILQPDGSIKEIPSLVMHYRSEFLNAMAKGPGAWIFWDEWGREGRHMRPLALKLTSWQKTLAGLDCRTMYLVLASNPADDEHQVEDTDTEAAMSSRIVSIEVLCDVDKWAEWMYEETASHRAIANYILENQNLITGRDSQGNKQGKFLSPRSWDIAAAHLHVHGNGTEEKPGDLRKNKLALAAVAGILGAKPANDLKNWMTKDRPMSVKHVLAGNFEALDGRISMVPPSLMIGLHYYLKTKDLTEKEADNLVEFLGYIPQDTSASVLRNPVNIRGHNMAAFAKRKAHEGVMKRVRKVRS